MYIDFYIRPFLSTLSHICVFCFFFLDALSLVTPLSFLISLSFLKPLSIVFQDEIWLVCFNVVVCARIQRRKKKTIERKKKFKEKKERKSVRKKKIKRVLIKFWEVKCKEEVLLWRRVDIPTNLKNTSYFYLHPFLFHSLYFYPTLCSNKVLIWSWRLCSSDIYMTK